MRAHIARLTGALGPSGLGTADALALLVLLGCAGLLTFAVWSATAVMEDPGEGGPAVVQSLASTPPGGSTAPVPVTTATPGSVVVHVAGQVARPGVITLPAGSRVADAVEAAGGLTPRASVEAVNLARPLVDGEQVRVPAEGEAPPPAPQALAPAVNGNAVLDLNAATAEQLQQLPGVGPVTAQRIVTHREQIGGFVDVAELLDVPGIGPARFADLEQRVRV